jgi:hypothetical protein
MDEVLRVHGVNDEAERTARILEACEMVNIALNTYSVIRMSFQEASANA